MAAKTKSEFIRTADDVTLTAAIVAAGGKVVGGTKQLIYVLLAADSARLFYPLLVVQNGGKAGVKPSEQPNNVVGLKYSIGMLHAVAASDDVKLAHCTLTEYSGSVDKCYTADENEQWAKIRGHQRSGQRMIVPFDAIGNIPQRRGSGSTANAAQQTAASAADEQFS